MKKIIIEFDEEDIDYLIATNSIKDLAKDWDWVKAVYLESAPTELIERYETAKTTSEQARLRVMAKRLLRHCGQYPLTSEGNAIIVAKMFRDANYFKAGEETGLTGTKCDYTDYEYAAQKIKKHLLESGIVADVVVE